jgi:hypothetical protein
METAAKSKEPRMETTVRRPSRKMPDPELTEPSSSADVSSFVVPIVASLHGRLSAAGGGRKLYHTNRNASRAPVYIQTKKKWRGRALLNGWSKSEEEAPSTLARN